MPEATMKPAPTTSTTGDQAQPAIRDSHQRITVALMLTLTFCTGMVDAIGFLGLDKVFTGNMTGNVVIIGMALTGAEGLPVFGPALALAGFALGAATGGLVLRSAPPAWTKSTTTLFGVAGGISISLGVLLFVLDLTGPGPVQFSITTLLGAAMGLQAATARALAVADLTTVVITSTIVGLAADQLSPTKRTRQGRRLAAVLMMLLGAVCGALLLLVHIGVALLLTGLLTSLVAAVGALSARRRNPVDPADSRPR